MIKLIISLFFSMSVCFGAIAQTQTVSEEEIKERTDAIAKTLRCVVCQNQSIYESNAPLAEDMRRAVEARVRAGDTDDEVREYLREPYGDFILMRPPFQVSTLALWIGPFLILAGLLFWFMRMRKSIVKSEPIRSISSSDRERLDQLLWRNRSDTEE